MFGRIRMFPGGRFYGHFLALVCACSTALYSSMPVYAEGSAQLGPWQALKDYSKGRTLRTVEASSLYVDILNAGEVIHVALCGAQDADSYSVKIFNPDGTEVFDSGQMAADPGCAENLAQIPHDSVHFEAARQGLYRLELENLDGLQFRYFDVSVAPDRHSPANERNSGRLWSYSWNLNSDSFAEDRSTDADFYALMPGGRENSHYIWKLDLNNFAGWEYDIVANDIGVEAPGSGYSTPREGHSVNYRFPLYLGVPAIAAPRPERAPVLSSVRFTDGQGEGFSLNTGIDGEITESGFFEFYSDVAGTYSLDIDLNSNGVYGDAGDTTLLGRAVAGLNRIEWDGRASNGEYSRPGTFTAMISVRLGEYHFIAEDVETSGGGSYASDPSEGAGLTIVAVDPDGRESAARVFWDDETLLGSGTSNTPVGALSSTPEGRHAWGDFSGEGIGNNSYIDTYVYGLQTRSTTQVRIAESDETVVGTSASLLLSGGAVAGQSLEVYLLDADLNADTLIRETVIVSAENKTTMESEQVLLLETGIDTGEFLGTLSTELSSLSQHNNGVLSVLPSQTIEVSYYDQLNGEGQADWVRAEVSINIDSDTDGDGIPDSRDVDDDNDGIPDEIEGNSDSDADGLPDSQDSDSDNDGLSDNHEVQIGGIYIPYSGLDSDGDGLDDNYDEDNNGIELNPPDLNADSVPDYQQSGGSDNQLPLTDTDSDGIPDYRDEDADGDGIDNLTDGLTQDVDGDGLVNALDTDSDADHIPDANESTVDTDADGAADYIDEDSDNDTISDLIEGITDSDRDGIPDYLDLDSDNDGLADSTESLPVITITTDPELYPHSVPDTDGDGFEDFRDLDSDNDGLGDLHESTGAEASIAVSLVHIADQNQDGADDERILDVLSVPDSDGDRIYDHRDLDSDQDSIPDLLESGGEDLNQDGRIDGLTDSDADGIHDLAELASQLFPDTDGDGVPDYLDLDSNGNGVPDLVENGFPDETRDGIVDQLSDSDLNGIADNVDAGVIGGLDADGDSIADFADASLTQARDSDGDGIADGYDADANGDGWVDLQPELAAATAPQPEEESDPILYTGLGGGCSISDKVQNGVDPVLPALVLLSVGGLFCRRLRNHSSSTMAVLLVAGIGLTLPNPRAYAGSNWLGDALQPHWYLGLGGGVSRLKPDERSIDYRLVDRQDSAFNAVLGVDVFRHLSGELQINHLGTARLEPSAEVTYRVFGASALLYTPAIGGQQEPRTGWRLFGRLGTGVLDNTSSVRYEKKNGYHLLSGLGVEYGTAGPLAVRLEYTRYDRDALYAGLALIYRSGTQGIEKPEAENAFSEVIKLPPFSAMPEAGFEAENDIDCLNTTDCRMFDGVVSGITFESGRASLTASAKQELAELAERLKVHSSIAMLVMAHTDSQGRADFNLALSRSRAEAVVGFLVSHGISSERLLARAYGESLPIASNHTPEGRAINRRVEFQVLQ